MKLKTTRSWLSQLRELNLREQLRSSYVKSGIKTDFDKYVRYMTYSSVGIGIATFIVLIALSVYFPDIIPVPFVGVFIILSLFLYGLISFVVGLLVASVFLLYIVNGTGNRKKRIETFLLNTSSYVMILSAAGTNPDMILRYAAEEDPDIILSDEIQSIVTRMDVMGQDIHSALDSTEKESPSREYTTFLKGLNMTVLTGGSLRDYTTNLINSQFESNRSKVQQFLDTLGFIGEIYIILLVFFPLFMTIMFSIMAMTGAEFGGLSVVTLMYIIGLIIIPVVGIAFLLLADTIQAGVIVGGRESILGGKRLAYGVSIILGMLGFTLYLFLVEGPAFFSSLSIPALLGSTDIATLIDALIVALIVALVPLSVYHHLVYSRSRAIDNGLPVLARGIADAGMIGMTLVQAIETTQRECEGPLGAELEKLNADISWRVPIDDALDKFAERCGTALSHQMALLLKAVNKAGENVRDGLRLIGSYIEETSNISGYMKAQMGPGIMIIYLSLAVFLIVEYMLATTLFAVLAETGTGGMMGGIEIGVFPYDEVIQATKISVVIEAVLAGLASGKMSTGSVLNGFIHMLILVTASFILFTVLI